MFVGPLFIVNGLAAAIPALMNPLSVGGLISITIAALFIWTGYGVALGIQAARWTGIVLAALLALLGGSSVLLGVVNPYVLPHTVVGALVMTWCAYYLIALGRQWERVEALELNPEFQPPPSDQPRADR
jgi:hypothetical protein